MNIELDPDDFSTDERLEMLRKATTTQLVVTLQRSLPKKEQEKIRKELQGVMLDAFAKIIQSTNNDLLEIADWLDSPEVDSELKEWIKDLELYPELSNVQCEGIV